MMLSFLCWHLLHSSLSGESSPWNFYAVREKKCVKGMTVEVGSYPGCPGCYLAIIRVFPCNRDGAINSFLLGMLLAPPVGR